jgi:hypothetical protein
VAAGRSDGPLIPLAVYPLPLQSPSELSVTSRSEATENDPSEEPEASPQTQREFPVLGPPPAPMPRALEWESVDEEVEGEEVRSQMGLGDLLAEALAAYQESRDIQAGARSAGPGGGDGSATGAAETDRDVPRYRGLGTRWTAGLALAPKPIDANSAEPNPVDGDDPAEAVTNPLLRLPNLTAEPRWVLPEADRRPAAGD